MLVGIAGKTMSGIELHPADVADEHRAPAEPAVPLPLADAIATGRTTELQRAALLHAARENRSSVAAEIRETLHPPEV
jgi:hypothetical protein